MLSNAYFLAKFRFDTAENEPAKNLQNFAKFANFADPNPRRAHFARFSDALGLLPAEAKAELKAAFRRACPAATMSTRDFATKYFSEILCFF